MKHILSLILGLTLAVYGSSAMADDTTTIWITKAGDNTAKVCTVHPLGYDGSKCLGTAPIKFADDATWDSVKDNYEVSSNTLNAISSKGACITVHGDGGISVTCAAPKAAAKK